MDQEENYKLEYFDTKAVTSEAPDYNTDKTAEGDGHLATPQHFQRWVGFWMNRMFLHVALHPYMSNVRSYAPACLIS